MRQVAEVLGFVSLAAGLHLAAFAVSAPHPGAEAAGAAGQAAISLAGAPPALSALIEAWQRPPDAATALTAPPAPRAPSASPARAVAHPPSVLSRQPPDAAPSPALPDTPPVTPSPASLPAAPAAPPVLVAVSVPGAILAPIAPAPGAGAPAGPRLATQSGAARPDAVPPAPVEAVPPPDVTTGAERQSAVETPRDAPEADMPPDTDTGAVRPAPRPQQAPETLPKTPREARPDVPSSTPSAAAQLARGQGAAQAAGASAQAARTRLSQGEQSSLMAAWGGQIRARIERRKRAVRGAGGRVVVELSVARGGTLRTVRVIDSSGDARLDMAALTAVRSTRRFPAAPDRLRGDVFAFRLPVRFKP